MLQTDNKDVYFQTFSNFSYIVSDTVWQVFGHFSLVTNRCYFFRGLS